MSVTAATTKMRMGRTIKIADEVHEGLMEVGGKSESFSDVVARLLECYKQVMEAGEKSETFSDIIKRLVESYEKRHPKR